MKEVDVLEKATNELHQLCLDTVQHIIDNDLFAKLWIPDGAVPAILTSWNGDRPSIYGRFDFRFDGRGVPKLLEYNADTPTSLLESAVIQWHWLQDYDAAKDQFNSIHEKLIAYWKMLREGRYLHDGLVYFASIDESVEDIITTEYMRDVANQAGLSTEFIYMKDIGWNGVEFTDEEERPIKNLFKLYPWEWLIHEEFADHIREEMHDMNWIEPAWKMILSNKGFLPIMYGLFPDCPYLLKSYFDTEIDAHMHEFAESGYVKKPLLSREGANITIVGKDFETIAETDGEYGEEGFIFQELCELPTLENKHPLIGSWVIGGESAGICVREAESLITTNKSRFIPHYIE
jgi:glutathionylspermidine synthase